MGEGEEDSEICTEIPPLLILEISRAATDCIDFQNFARFKYFGSKQNVIFFRICYGLNILGTQLSGQVYLFCMQSSRFLQMKAMDNRAGKDFKLSRS